MGRLVGNKKKKMFLIQGCFFFWFPKKRGETGCHPATEKNTGGEPRDKKMVFNHPPPRKETTFPHGGWGFSNVWWLGPNFGKQTVVGLVVCFWVFF